MEVSAIGLGCMGMDHAYGAPADREEMVKLIRRAVELGCNFFDTAVIYGEANEVLLGKALEIYNREDVIIATKFGIYGQEMVDGKLENLLNSKPDSIREQIEGSLERLGVDYIDLYYQHRVDPEVEPEAVAGVMKELMAERKIKHWGLSNAPLDYLRRAHAVCPVTCIENQYSMVFRQPEDEIFKVCEELGIGFVAYSPLGNGFLSGKYDANTVYAEGDFRSKMGRFSPEVMQKKSSAVGFVERNRRPEECHECPNRIGLGTGTKTVDCSDSRHNENAPSGRKLRRSSYRIESRGTEGYQRSLGSPGY